MLHLQAHVPFVRCGMCLSAVESRLLATFERIMQVCIQQEVLFDLDPDGRAAKAYPGRS